MDKSTAAKPGGPRAGRPPPGRTPPPPGRCRLRARSRFMQRSGSCSVVSKGSPSSTMLSRNWAKGVPRCSGRGHRKPAAPLPSPQHQASPGFCQPWRHPIPVQLWSVGPQDLRPRVPPSSGWLWAPCRKLVSNRPLTVVCVRHRLPHGEDHGQDEGGVAELLVVWGSKAGRQSPYNGRNAPHRRWEAPLASPCVSVCMSRASSTGSTDDTSVEMMAASRLHMAPKHLRSSSRSDTRCSWQGTLCLQYPEFPARPGSLHALPSVSHAPFGSRPPRPAQTRTGFSCTFSCTLQGLRQSVEGGRVTVIQCELCGHVQARESTEGRRLSTGGRCRVVPALSEDSCSAY